MNPNKQMPATRFVASNVIAKRIETGDGNVAEAVKDATEHLIRMGMHVGMAAEIAQDVRYRLEGDTELYRYQRLLATHDWTYGHSDDHSVWQRGRTERVVLQALAQQLDPERKLWQEYALCE